MHVQSGTTTLLFTDIEGSTRLWEQQGAKMSRALAQHDALSRRAVESHRGSIVKMTGDGMYAAFADPVDAINATVSLQQALSDPPRRAYGRVTPPALVAPQGARSSARKLRAGSPVDKPAPFSGTPPDAASGRPG